MHTYLHDRPEDVYQVMIAVRYNALCNEDDGAYRHENGVKCKQFQGAQLGKYCDHNSSSCEDLLHVVDRGQDTHSTRSRAGLWMGCVLYRKRGC